MTSVDSVQIKQTKFQLRICNFLLMALELAVLLKNPILTKRVVCELFDQSLPLLSFAPRPEFLNSYLLYVHQSMLTIPQEQMDGPMRRIGSCIAYEVNKDKIFHLKHEDSELYRKVLLTELAIDLRKWQTHTRVVTKQDKLTEEQLLKQKEQQAARDRGDVVPEADLIKDPQPYQVTETY